MASLVTNEVRFLHAERPDYDVKLVIKFKHTKDIIMFSYIAQQIYRFKYSPLSLKDKLKCAYWDLFEPGPDVIEPCQCDMCGY